MLTKAGRSNIYGTAHDRLTYNWLCSPIVLGQVDAARIVALHRYMTNPGAAVVVVLPIVNGQLPVVWIRSYHRFK